MRTKTPFELVLGAHDQLFNEGKVAGLVRQWQETGREELFADILAECYGLIGYSVANYLAKGFPGEFENLCHECVPKLRALLKRYDPERGRVFSFLNKALRNHLLHGMSVERTVTRYVSYYDPKLLAGFREAVSPPPKDIELGKILARFRTRFTEPDELRVQQWIIDYLLEHEKFPLRVRIEVAFASLGWDPHRFGTLRSYVIIALRRLCEAEKPPPPSARSVRDRQIEALLGPELYAKCASLFAGLSFKIPGPECLKSIKQTRRFLEEGKGERGFYYVYSLLRKGALEPAPEPVPLVINGNGEKPER